MTDKPPASTGAAALIPPAPAPRPRAARFRTAAMLAGGLAAAAAVAAGGALGGWWLPFAAGLILGAATRRLPRWRALGGAVLVIAVGWATPLSLMAARGSDVAGVAATVSALIGLPRSAAPGFMLALAVVCLQSVTGCALGRSVMNALRP